MAEFHKLSMEELGRPLPEQLRHKERFPLVLVLDSFRSLANVGSVFRTADGFRLEKLWLCGFTGQPPHREIQKTALGATETVPWIYEEKIEKALQQLKDQGFRLLALEQANPSICLENFIPETGEKLAIILGNEINGVSEEALKLSDGVLEIPQFGAKHSLNVAVSAGIVSWHVMQHWIREHSKLG